MYNAITKQFFFKTVLIAGLMFAFTYCVPPEQQQAEMLALQKAKRDSMRKVNYNKCAFKLSNADQYKLQDNWDSAIENYSCVVKLGCAEDFYDPLYEDLAFCFFKLGHIDSAAWAIEEGLMFNNTDRHMLELSAYYNKSDIDKQLQIWIQINSLYPDEIESMFTLADLYFDKEDYDAQIEILDQIILIDPSNKKADQQIVAAFESCGRDPLERIASAWENDKMNPNNANKYAKMLFDRGEYSTALIVLKEASSLHAGNRNIQNLLAQSYEMEFKMEEALAVYQDMAVKYPNDLVLGMKVVNLLIDDMKYQEALKIAEKALSSSGNDARALGVRGDIYFAVAENCSAGKGKLNFNDKLVYHMAWEDYKAAIAKGNSMVKGKYNMLNNSNNSMIISSKSDYFLASNANKVSGKVFKTVGECYSWITRQVTAK